MSDSGKLPKFYFVTLSITASARTVFIIKACLVNHCENIATQKATRKWPIMSDTIAIDAVTGCYARIPSDIDLVFGIKGLLVHILPPCMSKPLIKSVYVQ